MPTIVGDSFGDVERLWLADRSRQQAGIENALNRLLQAQAQRQDRKQRERQFQFNLAKENSDLADQRERMKMERARLDETIRSNKEAEKYNFGRLEALKEPKASVVAADMRRQEFIFKDLQDQADMGELPASRKEIEQLYPNGLPEQLESLHRRNQSARGELTRSFDFRRSSAERLNEGAALQNMIDQEKELGAEPHWYELGLGRSRANMDEWQGEVDAMKPELDAIRGSPEFKRGGMVIPRSGGGYEGADRPSFMGEPSFRFDLRPETLESITNRNGSAVGPSAQSNPNPGHIPNTGMGGFNPQAFRFIQKASELAEQRDALTEARDQIERDMPSTLGAPFELHDPIMEERKRRQSVLKNLGKEQKDTEKRLEELRKEAQEKAEKEKEQGKKSVDVSQFRFGGTNRPSADPMEVRRQAQAAIAAGKDPRAVFARALELGVDLSE